MGYTRVLFAGKFTPFHYGHLATVCEALSRFDEVVIGVSTTPNKTEIFSDEVREKMIVASINDFISMVEHRDLIGRKFSVAEIEAAELLTKNPKCLKIMFYNGLALDAAIRCKASFLICGEGGSSDKEDDKLIRMTEELTAVRGVSISTLILPAPRPELVDVSSSLVRKLMQMGEYITAMNYVTPSVHNILCDKYLRDIYLTMTDCKNFSEDYDIMFMNYRKRMYHNFSHIAYCWNMFEVYRLFEGENTTAIGETRMAFFWHDIEQGKNAVRRSTEMALNNLDRIWCHHDFLRSLINATDHENSHLFTKIEEVMHDIDLAIWGDFQNYGLYAWSVMREYMDGGCSRKDYIRGRTKFLQKFLEKENIFRSSYFYNRFDDVARENIRKERDFWLAVE